MLVLAIAAVIIVMSVRYYQSASSAQRANACLAYLQAVAAAADSLSEATQSYSGIKSSEIDAIVPKNEAVCNEANHSTVTVPGTLNQSRYIGFEIKLPEPACQLMMPALKASGHWVWDNNMIPLDEKNCHSIAGGEWIAYSRTKL